MLKRKYVNLLGIAALAAFVTGCGGNTGAQNAKGTELIKITKQEYDNLQAEKDELTRKLNEAENRLQAQKITFEKEKSDLASQLEASANSKAILLFEGKIKYEVEAGAIMDYEEAVVFRMLNDPEFKVNMEKGGSTADLAAISLLREISRDDRRVTKKEIQDYRKKVANIQ